MEEQNMRNSDVEPTANQDTMSCSSEAGTTYVSCLLKTQTASSEGTIVDEVSSGHEQSGNGLASEGNVDVLPAECLQPGGDVPVIDRPSRPAQPTVRFNAVGLMLATQDEPELMAEISQELSSTRFGLANDGSRGCRIVRARESIGGVVGQHIPRAADSTPVWCSYAGLWPVIEHLLAKRGAVAVRSPEKVLPEPDRMGLGTFEAVDESVLALVRQHERGIVRYERQDVDPAQVIAEIALSFPGLSIAVVATREDDVRHYANRLRKWLPVRALLGSGDPTSQDRVVLGTYTSMALCCAAIEHRDILIAVDAVEATHERGMEAMTHAVNARLYGLLPIDQKIAPRDQTMLRAVFGFEEIVLPKHGHHLVPVEVAWCRITGPQLGSSLDPIQTIRQSVWQNPIRNRRIARLAQALRTVDRARLVKDFPTVAEAWPHDRAPGVTILVESIDHGIILARQLPTWLLETPEFVWLDDLPLASSSFLAMEVSDPDQQPAQRIITPGGTTEMDLTSTDIVIRADGGIGQPSVDLDCYTAPDGTDEKIVLVDFDDRQSHSLRTNSRQRASEYRKRGWCSAGEDVVQQRVKEFLAQ